MKKRLLYFSLLGALAMTLCSCATQDMIAKAEGRPGPLDPPNQPPTKPNPAYYLLVPVVLPFDLVAWPFQLFYLQGNSQSSSAAPPPVHYEEEVNPNYPPPPSTSNYQDLPRYQPPGH